MNKEKIKKWGKELIPYIIIAIGVILFRTYIATPIMVSGDSMEPTLDGSEVMILNKLSDINRFDIVIFSYNGDNLIKRVIAKPGETIEYKNGFLFIDDELVTDNYYDGTVINIDKLTLREDEYYVLGDNRFVSKDSRIIGPVKTEQIMGTTNYIIFPFKEFGKIN